MKKPWLMCFFLPPYLQCLLSTKSKQKSPKWEISRAKRRISQDRGWSWYDRITITGYLCCFLASNPNVLNENHMSLCKDGVVLIQSHFPSEIEIINRHQHTSYKVAQSSYYPSAPWLRLLPSWVKSQKYKFLLVFYILHCFLLARVLGKGVVRSAHWITKFQP